jgi:hypothetical protein
MITVPWFQNALDRPSRLRRNVQRARVISLYRRDRRNVGDWHCAPREYVPLGNNLAVDVFAYAEHCVDMDLTGKVVIAGGGGLLVFPEILKRLLDSGAVVVGWGLGTNTHGKAVDNQSELLRRFALVGSRDWASGQRWVPCPSCLHPAFVDPPAPVHPVVIYEHHERKGEIPGDAPRSANDCSGILEAARFLGSGALVVTNSYHGAYWATLLGRRVTIYRPWSTKFYAMRHPPAIAEPPGWDRETSWARPYPEALSECRLANIGFARVVLSMEEFR